MTLPCHCVGVVVGSVVLDEVEDSAQLRASDGNGGFVGKWRRVWWSSWCGSFRAVGLSVGRVLENVVDDVKRNFWGHVAAVIQNPVAVHEHGEEVGAAVEHEANE